MGMYIGLILLLPLMGTVLGAALVLILRKQMPHNFQRGMTGFAAGVMVAASVWSLLIPAIEFSKGMDSWQFVPPVLGLLSGFAFLLLLDKWIPHLHINSQFPEGAASNLARSTMLILAVTLHNFPEGLAVGVVIAGALAGNEAVSVTSALVLSLGIALQNLPEGAIISVPLYAGGMSRRKAFGFGVLSGIVEPLGAIATIVLASVFIPALPYLLAFAAGAMLYVVVEELIPAMSEGKHSNIGVVFFALGFALMMILDLNFG